MPPFLAILIRFSAFRPERNTTSSSVVLPGSHRRQSDWTSRNERPCESMTAYRLGDGNALSLEVALTCIGGERDRGRLSGGVL